MVPVTAPLIGFSGEIIWPLGQLSLLVKIGDKEHSTSAWMNVVIVRSSSPYNGIIGRPRVRKIKAVPSTAHRMLKFPITGGILTLKSSKIILIECAAISGPERQPSAAHQAIEERIKNIVWTYGKDALRSGKKEEVKQWTGTKPKEVHYHSWLSNPVMVKKYDGSWRMCVDFKDLNKACPKDGYLLPEIDWKLESLYGFPFKCFLDAYKGYHQIKMAKEDEEKTAFITSQGIFCYSKMPFGLRNVRATYQRLVDKAFYKQIGRNLEVYMDDLVIKSHTEDEIIRDIEETFKTLRDINMKLNLKKCTFGVEEGMFLGYKVNTKIIKVCPNKVDDVLSLLSPKCLKDVQKLNGKLASWNRFLAKSAQKSLLFFKTLKKCTKKSDFHWTEEAEFAFKQMKQLIAELPTLTAPEEKEELIIYLSAAKEAVSAVLMTEREAKQMSIYFVSRALIGLKVNYTSMEKLVLTLVHANKRLKRYFQAYPVIVIMDQPIKQVLSKPEVAGRLQKWSIELGEYAIHYRPRVSVKGQILADFIVKRPEEDSPDNPMEVEEELPEPCILFTDGSSCADGFGAGLILTNPEGAEFTYALRFRFEATNNEAEYESLIAGLKIAEEMGVKNLQENVDSRLVANQVNGTYIAKEADMIRYLEKVLIKELKEKSINELEVLAVVEEEGDTWMTSIYKYLTKETLPVEVNKARAQKLTPITSPWPFYKWGIDIAGPFLEGPGKVKFLMVAIDYFTKWIEAKPVATITGNQVKKIMWDNIVCRFRLSGEIISDNEKQFQDNPFS
ncbi:reverse transcriptase domain-containing protein [Tanacetum coccineum]|uniref:Reverse transcriptase domain-containing protein n=1 Tax=Tanacetum coccineum TaxID=301880 RepID=A0ABQ5ICS1_9ASTR